MSFLNRSTRRHARSWLGALLLGGAALGASSASAQSCPATITQSTIVGMRCLNDAASPAINTHPCSAPGSTADLPATGRTVELKICSKSLNRVVGVRVLLPRKHYATPAVKPSGFYLLHGASAGGSGILIEENYTGWTALTDVENTTFDTHALVVMPEAGDIGWYSDWVKTPTLIGSNARPPQNWETFFFNEMRPIVETVFPINGQRVVAGLSMGGMGAISYAFRHPGFFRAAASFSGDLEVEANGVIPMGSLTAKGVLDVYSLWGAPSNPFWRSAIWKSHDPIQNTAALVDLPMWISAGNGQNPNNNTDIDAVEVGAWKTSTSFANKMEGSIAEAKKTRNVTGYVLRDMGSLWDINAGCAGQHTWTTWDRALRRAWPFLRAHLQATSTVPGPANLGPAACNAP